MYQIPSLKYKYGDLEPYIDEMTMRIHHTKHHQAYVDKLNAALEKYPDLAQKKIEDLMADLNAVPEDIRTTVRNNGGGHLNHSLFWEMLAPHSAEASRGKPREKTITLLEQSFGTFEGFQKKFKESALAVFGSGWAWLISDGKIITTPNQDTPISQGLKPLLGLDVWEHAYYLKYQNKRPDYVDAWWHVVNWDYIEQTLDL